MLDTIGFTGKMNHKLGVIIPFYGRWPAYYKLFLKNIKEQPVDILIFTDLEPTGFEPSNIKVIPFSLEEFKQRIRSLLDLEPDIKTSYKLCDFRPSYGLVFKEYLLEYDFWGWGDMDLVFGRIDEFINDEILNSHDAISARSKWLSGSFCLLRNNDTINRLFLGNDDYKRVFTDTSHFSFSECGKKWDELRSGIDVCDIELEISNTTRQIADAEKKGLIRCYYRDMIKESIPVGDYVKIESGNVEDQSGKKYLSYHFISEKKKAAFDYPDWEVIPDPYYVDNCGFYHQDQFENRGVVRKRRTIRAIPRMLIGYWRRLKNKLAKQVR